VTEGVHPVRWTASALKMLEDIMNRRIQAKIFERAKGLNHEPEKQGKSLIGELAGFRSLRVIGQRYRIIFRVEQGKVFITAVGIHKDGSRSDIYSLARKLLHLKFV